MNKDLKQEDFALSWPLKDMSDVTTDESARLQRLNEALGRGMKPMLKKHCKREFEKVKKRDEKAVLENARHKRTGGREMVFIFLDFFKTRGELNHGARVEQIYTIKYPGDKHMSLFLDNWVDLVNDADAQLGDASLLRLLVFKLKGGNGGVKSEDMVYDLQQLDRMERSDPNHS